MNILVELIRNDKMTSGKSDTRYNTIMPLCNELKSKKHNIYVLAKKGVNKTPFEKYSTRLIDNIDFYICHAPYRGSKSRYEFFKKRGTKMVVYEAGWLNKSTFVDRDKLFADSYYYNILPEEIQKEFDFSSAESLRKKILNDGTSKWMQKSKQEIPEVDFIFIPGQVLYDSSVVFYSKTGMLEFIEQTIQFAKRNKLDVIYKPHPGLFPNNSIHGKQILYQKTKDWMKEYNNFHVVETSIFELMQKARFTACINAGSVVDNMITQTPVYTCGKSFFSKTHSVIYDQDVERGLQKMLSIDYNPDKVKDDQIKTLWWLENNLLKESLPAKENIKRLEKHAGIKF